MVVLNHELIKIYKVAVVVDNDDSLMLMMMTQIKYVEVFLNHCFYYHHQNFQIFVNLVVVVHQEEINILLVQQ